MYITIIEWDGMKPPTTYYHRLRKLAFKVRGNKNKSPLSRRSTVGKDHGVIMQEGAIMTSSESLARTIAYLAREHGASFVAVGEVDLDTEFMPNAEDIQAVHRIEQVFGRRGRPETQKMDWAVMCIEEATMHQVFDEYKIATCPFCMATNIRARPGRVKEFKMPKKSNYTDTWIRTRFSTGTFEPSPVSATSDEERYKTPPKKSDIKFLDEKEARMAKMVAESLGFMSDIALIENNLNKGGDNPRFLRMMDAAFLSRVFYKQENRQRARIVAITEVFKTGANPNVVSLLENDNEVDLLGMAPSLSPTVVASFWSITQFHKDSA